LGKVKGLLKSATMQPGLPAVDKITQQVG